METEHWKEEKWEIVGECYVHGLMENDVQYLSREEADFLDYLKFSGFP